MISDVRPPAKLQTSVHIRPSHDSHAVSQLLRRAPHGRDCTEYEAKFRQTGVRPAARSEFARRSNADIFVKPAPSVAGQRHWARKQPLSPREGDPATARLTPRQYEEITFRRLHEEMEAVVTEALTNPPPYPRRSSETLDSPSPRTILGRSRARAGSLSHIAVELEEYNRRKGDGSCSPRRRAASVGSPRLPLVSPRAAVVSPRTHLSPGLVTQNETIPDSLSDCVSQCAAEEQIPSPEVDVACDGPIIEIEDPPLAPSEPTPPHIPTQRDTAVGPDDPFTAFETAAQREERKATYLKSLYDRKRMETRRNEMTTQTDTPPTEPSLFPDSRFMMVHERLQDTLDASQKARYQQRIDHFRAQRNLQVMLKDHEEQRRLAAERSARFVTSLEALDTKLSIQRMLMSQSGGAMDQLSDDILDKLAEWNASGDDPVLPVSGIEAWKTFGGGGERASPPESPPTGLAGPSASPHRLGMHGMPMSYLEHHLRKMMLSLSPRGGAELLHMNTPRRPRSPIRQRVGKSDQRAGSAGPSQTRSCNHHPAVDGGAALRLHFDGSLDARGPPLGSFGLPTSTNPLVMSARAAGPSHHHQQRSSTVTSKMRSRASSVATIGSAHHHHHHAPMEDPPIGVLSTERMPGLRSSATTPTSMSALHTTHAHPHDVQRSMQQAQQGQQIFFPPTYSPGTLTAMPFQTPLFHPSPEYPPAIVSQQLHFHSQPTHVTSLDSQVFCSPVTGSYTSQPHKHVSGSPSVHAFQSIAGRAAMLTP